MFHKKTVLRKVDNKRIKRTEERKRKKIRKVVKHFLKK